MNFLNGLEKQSRTVKAKTQVETKPTEFVILDALAMRSFCQARPQKVKVRSTSACRGAVGPQASLALRVMQNTFASSQAS